MLLATDDGRTRPPVRLRMTSADVLCARSIEVEWEDGSGVRQSWSSWAEDLPENSWYEATKLLPSCATDISVHFEAQGVGGPYPVCKVHSRRTGCPWVQASDGSYKPDIVSFRDSCDCLDAGVDVVFELCGPMHGCYVHRAWNAARHGHRKQAWELWREKTTRPKSDQVAVLEAADAAAPLDAGHGDPRLHYVCATQRMCAGARLLTDIHRQTLHGLRELDARFTGQWVGVNVGNTASAGLGIASAVLLFLAPPVGVGLGIGSALTGGVAFAGDSLADWAHHADLRRQLSLDEWNAFALSELLEEWSRALQSLGASCHEGLAALGGARLFKQPEAPTKLADVVDNGLTAGTVGNGAAATATQVVARVGDIGRGVAVATQAIGITGALISTGFAIKGWSTTKSGQAAVRAKIAELVHRLLNVQLLLAQVDVLECPLCLEEVTLADDVRRCGDNLHCFHELCIQQLADESRTGAKEDKATLCPACRSELQHKGQLMADSLKCSPHRHTQKSLDQRSQLT